jgi:hypothetical protein
MFQRARSEFLRLFYRGQDKPDAADSALSQKQLISAVQKRDFDLVRLNLFEQALKMSQERVALLWLAFAALPGKHPFRRII